MSSLKFIAIVCAALLLLAAIGLSQDSARRDLASRPLKLTIRSAKPAYDLKDAWVGNVVILAQDLWTIAGLLLLATRVDFFA